MLPAGDGDNRRAAAQVLLEELRAAGRLDGAAVDEEDVLGGLGLFDIRRRDDEAAANGILIKEPPHAAPADGVDGRGRLVQHNVLGAAREGHRDAEAAADTVRQRVGVQRGVRVKLKSLAEGQPFGRGGRFIHRPLDHLQQLQVLRDGQRVPRHVTLEADTDANVVVKAGLAAVDEALARRGCLLAGEDLHQRALAGAAGPNDDIHAVAVERGRHVGRGADGAVVEAVHLIRNVCEVDEAGRGDGSAAVLVDVVGGYGGGGGISNIGG